MQEPAPASKRVPHDSLEAVKAAFALPEALNRTTTALEGAETLGMDDADVVATIQTLTKHDFEKSMTSHADVRIWQDVYKPMLGDICLYVKVTLNAQGEFLLISFKEA